MAELIQDITIERKDKSGSNIPAGITDNPFYVGYETHDPGLFTKLKQDQSNDILESLAKRDIYIADELNKTDGLIDAVNNNMTRLEQYTQSFQNIGSGIGTILPFWDKLGVIPTGWSLCDGSLITDNTSPFMGRRVPNLNNRFLLGTTGAVFDGMVPYPSASAWRQNTNVQKTYNLYSIAAGSIRLGAPAGDSLTTLQTILTNSGLKIRLSGVRFAGVYTVTGLSAGTLNTVYVTISSPPSFYTQTGVGTATFIFIDGQEGNAESKTVLEHIHTGLGFTLTHSGHTHTTTGGSSNADKGQHTHTITASQYRHTHNFSVEDGSGTRPDRLTHNHQWGYYDRSNKYLNITDDTAEKTIYYAANDGLTFVGMTQGLGYRTDLSSSHGLYTQNTTVSHNTPSIGYSPYHTFRDSNVDQVSTHTHTVTTEGNHTHTGVADKVLSTISTEQAYTPSSIRLKYIIKIK